MKISELPQAAEITGEEILPVVQNGETKKVSRDNLVGTVPNGLTVENGKMFLTSKGEKVDEGAQLPTVTVDDELSAESTNPVQNKTVKAELDKKLGNESGSVQSNHLANGSVTEEKLSEEVKSKLNEPQITVDSELSAESENPAQNKAIANSLSNAVKGKVIGEILRIDDISPIPHSLKISVKSESETVLTGVTVRRSGKNLIDYTQIANISTSVATLIDNGFIVEGAYCRIANIPVTPNTDYYLSFTTECLVGNTKFVNVTGGGTYLAKISNGLGKTFNSGNNTAININFYSSTSTESGKVKFTNIQLEPGTQQTEYEPYVPVTEATVSDDGTVESLTSIYPNTVLVTDSENVTLECEYNRDLNKVINNIIDAVISLGGNV